MIAFIKSFKYTTPFVLFILSYLAFNNTGILCWVPLLYIFFFIPILELFIAPDVKNLDAVEEQLAKSNKFYDIVIWMTVPLQYLLLIIFLLGFKQNLAPLDIAGRIIAMGLLCGTFGINAAHELGHRVNPFEQFLAKLLLLTSLYMHFFIEHNKGHHKNVATPNDPSTAKYKQNVYTFWLQTFIGTYMSAWEIAVEEAEKKNKIIPQLNNEMFLFQLVQLLFIVLIAYFLGFAIMFYFIAAAIIGATLLETVNYIEHYGLAREKKEGETYERVKPQHSWNSNHVIGRLMLFELSRHSDHHYLASRKYQILRNMEEAPQMPTGYPGMIVLSLFPPIWFFIMHKQMKKYSL
jgi:alkane 1-monooxygenase